MPHPEPSSRVAARVILRLATIEIGISASQENLAAVGEAPYAIGIESAKTTAGSRVSVR